LAKDLVETANELFNQKERVFNIILVTNTCLIVLLYPYEKMSKITLSTDDGDDRGQGTKGGGGSLHFSAELCIRPNVQQYNVN